MKFAVGGGHGDGSNPIPMPWKDDKPAYKTYAEGTSNRLNAEAVCKALPAVYNFRPEKTWPSFGTKASRIRKACGTDTAAFEFHTNWSINGKGQPNRGTLLVIVSLCYEDGANRAKRAAEEIALATKWWKPLADKWGLKFAVRTKKGGGNWDYYSFINCCKKQKIAHPMIIEFGYHMDFAEHQDEWRKDIAEHMGKIIEMEKVATPAPLQGVYYTVVRGDTLSAIGNRYGVKWQNIAAANSIKAPYLIITGQKLLIPGAAAVKEPIAQPIIHTVVKGESLSQIAKIYGMRWQDVAENNGIKAPWIIHLGQKLIIK